MYKLSYRNKFDGEEMTIVGKTEENCIKRYKRETAAVPQNYEVISIVNMEKSEEKSYNDTVKGKAEKVIEDIEKVVKSMIKNPYTGRNKKREKKIKADSSILKYIKKNYCNGDNFIIIDNKVVVNCDYCIFIEPTEEWFLNA